MKQNPFRYLQPVTGQRFVGRWPLVNEIVQDLLMESGDSHVLIAGPRCGKTSLLRVIEEQLRQPAQGEGAYLPIPVYVDFKANLFDSAEAVFAFLFQRVYHQVNTTSLTLGLAPIRAAKRWLTELVIAPQLTAQDFEAGVHYLLEQLDAAEQPTRLILLLDEAGKSLDQPWTAALYTQARNLLAGEEFNQRVRMVLASSQRFLEQNPLQEALCSMLQLHSLQALDQAALDELFAYAPGLPVATQAAISAQSGGHPFLAQYLLYQVWERTKGLNLGDVDVNQIERLGVGFLHKHAIELEGWLSTLSDDDRTVYQALSLTDAWMTEEQILATVAAPVQRMKRVLFTLCVQGLAVHDEHWTRFHYTGKIFRSLLSSVIPGPLSEGAPDVDSSRQMPTVYHINIDTRGGAYIAGGVSTEGGNFVGRNAAIGV